MKTGNGLAFVLSLALAFSFAAGDFGPCTFGPDRCSCRMGSENQGKCWDHRLNIPGTCQSRFCKRGWTCSCGARTHLCYLENRTAIIIDPKDKDKAVAPCPIDPVTGFPGRKDITVASEPEISLGSLQYDVSPKGAKADDCNQIAWWHNGVLRNQHFEVGKPPADINVTKELDERENHYLLEARGGDIFAWRFRDASYYCQIHNIRLDINGTIIEDVFTSPDVKITFAREFSKDWFSPSFEPVYGTNEIDDPVLTHFIEPRSHMFSGVVIPPNENVDLWEPIDQSDADKKKSNWYWRLEVKPSVTTTQVL